MPHQGRLRAVELKETEKLVKQRLVTNTGSLRLTSVLSSLLQGDKQTCRGCRSKGVQAFAMKLKETEKLIK